MIWKTSWKNIWRNKTRSLVVIISVTLGVVGGLFYAAFIDGMIKQRIDNVLNNEIGHIQIHNKDFRSNNEIIRTIPEGDKVINELKNDPEIQAVSGRLLINGMLGVDAKNSGIQMLAVDPENEKTISGIYQKIIPGTGSWDKINLKNKIYIGEELAKNLNIINYNIRDNVFDSLREIEVSEEVLQKLEPLRNKRFKNEKIFIRELKETLKSNYNNSVKNQIMNNARYYRKRAKLIFSFVNADSSQTSVAYGIGGIYKINNTLFEKSYAFINANQFRKMAEIPKGQYHQIVVKLKDSEKCTIIKKQLANKYSSLEVISWKDIQADMAFMKDFMGIMYNIFMVFILAALSFGIINTMLMAVMERTKELGMLTAIGMNRKKVFKMIMLESVFLSLSGGVVGMILGKILIAWTNHTGIYLAGVSEGMESFGFAAICYPSINDTFFINLTILVIITGILSAIYPAYKALKLNPADALRTD